MTDNSGTIYPLTLPRHSEGSGPIKKYDLRYGLYPEEHPGVKFKLLSGFVYKDNNLTSIESKELTDELISRRYGGTDNQLSPNNFIRLADSVCFSHISSLFRYLFSRLAEVDLRNKTALLLEYINGNFLIGLVVFRQTMPTSIKYLLYVVVISLAPISHQLFTSLSRFHGTSVSFGLH